MWSQKRQECYRGGVRSVFIGGFSCRGAMGGEGLIMGLIEKVDWSDYGDIDTEYRRARIKDLTLLLLQNELASGFYYNLWMKAREAERNILGNFVTQHFDQKNYEIRSLRRRLPYVPYVVVYKSY